MRTYFKCFIISLVMGVSLCSPVSSPVYSNVQYVTAQAVPAAAYRQPAASGYIQPPQYYKGQVAQVPQYQQVTQPAAPVYESRPNDGLQNYASHLQGQNIEQLFPASNTNGQVQTKVAGQYYLNQIQSAQLAAQAQEAFSAAQKKTTPQTPNRQHIPTSQGSQPPHYVRDQPQLKYISRPISAPSKVQYQQQQPQQYQQPQQFQPTQQYQQPQQYTQKQQYRQQQPLRQVPQEEKEDYDPNPSYQFGFDVNDDLYTNYQNRKEQREGNKITGSYSVVDSDGFIRTVQYTADPKEGFKAEVTRQPTDIVVKIPKPDPQFQQPHRQQQQRQPQQYIQEVPTHRVAQEQKQQSNIVYQYQ